MPISCLLFVRGTVRTHTSVVVAWHVDPELAYIYASCIYICNQPLHPSSVILLPFFNVMQVGREMTEYKT